MNSRAVTTIQQISPTRGSISDTPILNSEVIRRPIPLKSRNTARYDRNPTTFALRDARSFTCLSIADRMLPIHLRGWIEFGTSPTKRSISSAATMTRIASSQSGMLSPVQDGVHRRDETAVALLVLDAVSNVGRELRPE